MNRRLGFSLALLLPALILDAAPAQAQPTCGPSSIAPRVPSVVVCVNGVRFDVPSVLVDGKTAVLPRTTVSLGGGASFFVSASFNSDPFSNFTFGSVIPGDFGVFTFDAYFTTPVVGGPYTFAHSFYTSNLTLTGALVGPATGTIANGTYPTYLSGFTDLGSLGVDVGMGACTLSTPSAINCPPGDKQTNIAPISPTLLTAHLSYAHGTTGTGASSTAGFAGGVEISNAVATTVPEPTTVVMMSVGLLLLGGAVRQKRKAL